MDYFKNNATHDINDTPFIIEQDVDGWFWSNTWAESEGFFTAQSEALADAIRWTRDQEQKAAEQAEAEQDGRSYAASVAVDYRN